MFKGVMQMALPTQQPLNWLQRLAAWLFRIDTRQQIIHKAPVYIKGGSPVEFSVVTEPMTSREWRPGDQMPAPAPKRHNQRHANGQWKPAEHKPLTKSKIEKRKGWRMNLSAMGVYREVAQMSNWDQIVSRPDWYRIYQVNARSGNRSWRVEIVNKHVQPNTRVKSRTFETQDKAIRFVTQLINIHLSKAR
jgi:hypothetical protein